jgi:hypothetical protein
MSIMEDRQKKMLHDLAKWHAKEFYNRMEDRWTDLHCSINKECTDAINRIEQEYIEHYGPLPEWKYIDDVFAAIKEYK